MTGGAGARWWSATGVQAAAVSIVALAAYATRLLPDVGFWDTAVFQGAAPTLGLTHPTGYPTFLLLGWLWTHALPMVTPALAMNMLTAVAGALAVGLVFVVARRIGAGAPAAAAAALTLGLMVSFWQTAVRADPHPLHVLLATGIVLLLLEWDRRAQDRYLTAAALVFGLAMGNHMLTTMLAPGIGVYVLTTRPSILRRPRMVLKAAAALLLGMAVYAYVPLRAAANPAIHHDFAPTTVPLFLRYVLGQDFAGSMGFLSPDGLGAAARELGAFASQTGSALTPAIAIAFGYLALAGLYALLRDRSWRTAWLLGATGALTLYARLTYANGDIERYALYPIAVAAALAALGAQALWDGLLATLRLDAMEPDPGDAGRAPDTGSNGASAGGSRPSRTRALVLVPAILLVVPIFLFLANGDRVRPMSARCYVDAVAAQAPRDASIVSWWSMTTPLWYAQAVEHARPDITVILAGSLAIDEVARLQPEGRPVVVIQSDDVLQQIRDAGYALRQMDFCGREAWEVTGPAETGAP